MVENRPGAGSQIGLEFVKAATPDGYTIAANTLTLASLFSEPTANFKIDADNRHLWRVSPRKLEVEAWRDSVLAVTGELDRTAGGPSVRDILSSQRRALYAAVSRNGDKLPSDEFLRLFDFPSARAKDPFTTHAEQAIATVERLEGQSRTKMQGSASRRRHDAIVAAWAGGPTAVQLHHV